MLVRTGGLLFIVVWVGACTSHDQGDSDAGSETDTGPAGSGGSGGRPGTGGIPQPGSGGVLGSGGDSQTGSGGVLFDAAADMAADSSQADAGLDSAGDDGGGAPDGGQPPLTQPDVPDWVRTARIGGLSLTSSMTDQEVRTYLLERQAENVSVVELDTTLSYYLSDQAFAAEVSFLDKTARMAHELGLRAVIYYPSLEVLTKDADNGARTMFQDHPDWVQRGISGAPNVFVGGLEHWVSEGTESAWMCPNSPYREYYFARIRKLAATALDGVWVDVPIYLETGTKWPGTGQWAAAAFRAWSAARGMGNGAGLDVPTAVDFTNDTFRVWVRWRHENLAQFVEDVRQNALAVNPSFMVIVETFPIDDMDGTAAGLDGSYRAAGHNFIRVWEVDSVSNVGAMQYATIEDFSGKLAMFKWALAAERGNPAWVFSYGNQPLDASLVMAAAAGVGVAPFESKTPNMTETAGSDFRQRWFGFLRDHSDALLKTPRVARAGIWYSSPTRDYYDMVQGGEFGLYVTTQPPVSDPDWWAQSPDDSALPKPHLGGWRGAVHAITQFSVPWRPVLDPANATADSLRGLSLLWLPSVAALSDASATMISQFVSDGGALLVTGAVPGTLDELGRARGASALASVLGLAAGEVAPGPREHVYGNGLAIFRPDLDSRETMTAFKGDTARAAAVTAALRDLFVRHVSSSDVAVESPFPGLMVEVAHQSTTRSYLFVLNYSGLKLPLVSAPRETAITFRAPAGSAVSAARTFTPDANGTSGPISAVPLGDGQFRLNLRVDQFQLVELDLVPL